MFVAHQESLLFSLLVDELRDFASRRPIPGFIGGRSTWPVRDMLRAAGSTGPPDRGVHVRPCIVPPRWRVTDRAVRQPRGTGAVNGLSITTRRAAKHAVRTVSSTAIRALGVDVTERFSARSCLVVAPHPDDETFGCASAIARMRFRGTDVRVVFVTGGEASPKPRGMSTPELVALRRAETSRALRTLGMDESDTVHLDFLDGELTARFDEVADALADLVRTTRPQQVLVTSVNDRHPDHEATGRAARTVMARFNRPPTLFEYPIWQRVPAVNVARDATRAAMTRRSDRSPRPIARPRLVRTDAFLPAKQRAIAAYESQLPHFPVGFVEDFLLPYESFTEIVVGAQSIWPDVESGSAK